MSKFKIIILFIFSFSFIFSTSPNPRDGAIKKIESSFSPENLFSIKEPTQYKNGILFTYFSNERSTVFLGGSFNDWQRIPMKKNLVGISYYLLNNNLLRGNHRYRFSVQGIWENDPANSKRILDRTGNEVSFFTIDEPVIFVIENPEIKKNSNELENYLFYLLDDGYQKVFWLSDIERWKKDSDPMTKKGNYWVIEKKIFAKRFEYIFWADNQYILDSTNTKNKDNGYGLTVNFFNR